MAATTQPRIGRPVLAGGVANATWSPSVSVFDAIRTVGNWLRCCAANAVGVFRRDGRESCRHDAGATRLARHHVGHVRRHSPSSEPVRLGCRPSRTFGRVDALGSPPLSPREFDDVRKKWLGDSGHPGEQPTDEVAIHPDLKTWTIGQIADQGYGLCISLCGQQAAEEFFAKLSRFMDEAKRADLPNTAEYWWHRLTAREQTTVLVAYQVACNLDRWPSE